MKFGLLLPHFGATAHRDVLFIGAQRAETLNYDSLWVRDHVVFEPHGEFEEPSRRFFEALTTLTAVGAATTRIRVGTAALIPSRHPVIAALTISTMTQMLGPRVEIGVGAGNSDHEFATVGLAGVDRRSLVVEYIEVLRELWAGNVVSHSGESFEFEDVLLDPPPAGPIPIWYCGNTPASVRRAVEACDGWLPGRINLATLDARVRQLKSLAEQAGRAAPTVGIVPATSVDRDRGKALDRANVDGLLRWANNARLWVPPASGRFERIEDLTGVLMAGTPTDIIENCESLQDAGVDHIVFDFRMDFTRWSEQVELIAEEVLPALKT